LKFDQRPCVSAQVIVLFRMRVAPFPINGTVKIADRF
jgi:hypothetical protein